MQPTAIIPIFPLGLVLLPAMPLPLHIFEERYKLMTKTCMEQDREFGIVYFSGDQFEAKGCTAVIEKVIKKYSDGRLDILTQGRNRFAIKELFDEKPYLQASVEFFDDRPAENTNAESFQKLVHRVIQLLKQINPITDQYKDDSFSGPLDSKAVSFLAAACDGFSFEEKQRFLEMTSTARRLRKAGEALEKLFERLSITREIERIIGGNGNLPRSLQTRLKQD